MPTLSSCRRCSGAFSLVEILAAVAVLAIMLAVMAPQMSRARAAARAAVSQSNLRQLGFATELYTQSANAFYPFGSVGVPYPIYVNPDEGPSQSWGSTFAFGKVWPVLFRGVAPWGEFLSSWISPGTPNPEPVLYSVGYSYSHSFSARPELWAFDAAPDPWQLRGVRSHEVLFPAAKVMFWDSALAYELRPVELMPGMLANPTPMLFADSHVAVHSTRDASAPRTNLLNPDREEARQPLNNTLDGVRGLDYR